MRVALLIAAHHGGGAEYTARQWIRQLGNLGHEVFVYTFQPGTTAPHYGPGVTCRHLSINRKLLRLCALPAWLAHRVHSDRIDVLLSMSTTPNLVALLAAGALRRRRPAVAISERNMPSIYLPTLGQAGRLQRILARRLYRRADGVVAISHPVAADVLSGYAVPQECIYVVPNPSLPGSKETPRGASSVKLVFAGRMVPQKRPMLFLAVVSELRRRGRSVEAYMYGDGPLTGSAISEARREELPVEVRPWRDDWMDEHAGQDGTCLLLTSGTEGLGNVLINAFQRRLPAVAWSGALGMADAVIPEVTGMLSLTDLPHDFADSVERAVSVQFDVADWSQRWAAPQSAQILERALQLAAERRLQR